jgi:hypothetical protein
VPTTLFRFRDEHAAEDATLMRVTWPLAESTGLFRTDSPTASAKKPNETRWPLEFSVWPQPTHVWARYFHNE